MYLLIYPGFLRSRTHVVIIETLKPCVVHSSDRCVPTIDGPTFRPKANKLGGQKQFPYMVDPNSKTDMYESDAIIDYLFKAYGEGSKV